VLACACADGLEAAWDHFIREYRPTLYRAADAIDPTGGARDLADSLYAELFGLSERDGQRRSHLRYYHGRSSLGTWLRAVLSQRHVDRIRAGTRMEPLPDEGEALGLVALTISATVLLDALTALDINGGMVALAVLIGAGLLLLASGILAAVREQRQAQQQDDPYPSFRQP